MHPKLMNFQKKIIKIANNKLDSNNKRRNKVKSRVVYSYERKYSDYILKYLKKNKKGVN